MPDTQASVSKVNLSLYTIVAPSFCKFGKGKPEYYRGTPVEITLKPKIQEGIAVSKIPVRQVIETAKHVLHTDNIGVGRIFITDVENIVRVRTREEGCVAL